MVSSLSATLEDAAAGFDTSNTLCRVINIARRALENSEHMFCSVVRALLTLRVINTTASHGAEEKSKTNLIHLASMLLLE